jgi:hypothetical protein
MSEDPGTQTRIVDVKGRSIVVRQLKDAQLILMGRDAATLSKPNVEPGRKLEVAGYIMDTFESTIVQPDDKAYVISLIRQGELELQDLLGFMTAFNEDAAPKKATVRRGRPPRAK